MDFMETVNRRVGGNHRTIMKPKILIITGCYLPGEKAGGPIQSIKNIINTFYDAFDFYVVTSDRDMGDSVHYKNVQLHTWTQYGFANVYYADSSEFTFSRIFTFLMERNYQTVYLNSFFNWKYSIKWMVVIRKSRYMGRIVMAPRGEFSLGAYRQKYLKKQLFTILAKKSGIYNWVVWQATSQDEIEDIKRVWGKKVNILKAENIMDDLQPFQRNLGKHAGDLKAVFISRIHPKKNLLYAIEVFRHIRGAVSFSIYGPMEDTHYWEKCEKEIASLPANVQVMYGGVLKHEEVRSVLKQNHLFILPTVGENFGHSILESMSVGTPVLISDQTPWHSLREHYAGCDVNLGKREDFIESVQFFIDMDNIEYESFEKGAYRFVQKLWKKDSIYTSYNNLFIG